MFSTISVFDLSVDGDWFEWSPWSHCTVSCQGGLRSRSRECDMTSYGNLTAPCSGNATEIQACHTFPCTPEGELSMSCK